MDAQGRIALATSALTQAASTLYGLDGSTVEQAAAAAWTPTGPPMEELRAGIEQVRMEAAGEERPRNPVA